MVKEDYLASNCSSNDFILASYYCMMKVLSLEIVIFLVTVFWIVLALYPKRKEAIKWFETTVLLEKNFGIVHHFASWAYAQKGMSKSLKRSRKKSLI